MTVTRGDGGVENGVSVAEQDGSQERNKDVNTCIKVQIPLLSPSTKGIEVMLEI